jgi:hypothetical protein
MRSRRIVACGRRKEPPYRGRRQAVHITNDEHINQQSLIWAVFRPNSESLGIGPCRGPARFGFVFIPECHF